MYRVRVTQGENTVNFGFNRMSDAIEFVSRCMEVGDLGTEIYIKEIEEED